MTHPLNYDPFLERDSQEEKEWIAKVKKTGCGLRDVAWSECPIKDVFNTERLPPILPGKVLDVDHLKSLVDSYLCPNCCNYRVMRTLKTSPSCVDVYEIRTNQQL